MGRNRSLFVLVSLFFVIMVITGKASAFSFSKETCERYGLGSNWYCEEEKKEANPLASPDEIMQKDILPEQKAELLNRLWEIQQKRAVITGKREDLEKAIIVQKYLMKLGGDYARNMIRLAETMPEHSNSASYYERIADRYIKAEEQEAVLKKAKDRYALAFIYSSGCPHCIRQLPILHTLKENIGITLLGVSIDGGVYPGLDQVVVDSEITKDPSFKGVPMLALVDSKTSKRLFISRGITPRDRLEELIYQRIKEVGNE